ncbi:MAG TPA: hypothetical protein VKP30_31950 [Polyangiaceae bacterium]|nr:hypothetical protein [Polyangiaceae bacterium]
MLLLTTGLSAAAEQVNVALEFNAPSGCSDRETFATSLRSRSNRIQIVVGRERNLVVSVRLTPSERGVHGELWLSDARREPELRAVEGVDCAEVVEALSLTAALAIEQTVALDTPRASSGAKASEHGGDSGLSASASPRSMVRVPPNEPSSSPDCTSSTQTSWMHAQVLVDGLISHRLSTQNSIGASLFFLPRIRLGLHHSVEVGFGAIYMPESVLQPASRLRVSYVGGGFQLCPYVFELGELFSVSPCALLEVGSLKVHDRTVEVAFPSERLIFTAGGGGRVKLRLTRRLGLASSVALMAPIPTRRYVTGEPNVDVGKTAPGVWQLNLGWLFEW